MRIGDIQAREIFQSIGQLTLLSTLIIHLGSNTLSEASFVHYQGMV